MPNRLPSSIIAYLGSAFAASIAVYVALVVGTIALAARQTDLVSSVGDTEAAISTLESQYYTSISDLTSMAPATLGLTTPHNTAYVRASEGIVLTRAGN